MTHEEFESQYNRIEAQVGNGTMSWRAGMAAVSLLGVAYGRHTASTARTAEAVVADAAPWRKGLISLLVVLAVGCAHGVPVEVQPGGYCTEETPEYCEPPTDCELIEQAPAITGELMRRWYLLKCEAE